MIGPFLQEIADVSGLTVPYQITQEIIAELQKRRLAPTREAVRKIFYFKYHKPQHKEYGVFSGSELFRWEQEQAEDSMSAADYARSLGPCSPSIWLAGKR